ncbi:NAD-dependent epimerase/dehydratase family protein [Flavobacterium sp. ZB4P23]|uniref:SDR family oxidoreductase n=1 Tax=unclassified Flavobacterium TaxID=196869 RepID=UPI000F84B309|nr:MULTISPECIES: sugar nucleotide-binding protein [unclassified Flavobacterium]RTY83747.1 NAD-dependent epimerase/dehydratase family protein [Flavobacterium sp. ZB4P23]RTZ06723.1 NAD-dependent epimerase/dehydratase family protein [Flavobacterium sp. GSP6]
MNILVLGATGMAGHTVALYFKEKGYNVVSYSRTPFLYCDNIIGDVFETEKFKSMLFGENFDVVINCIGILNQDAENYPSKAVYLNSYLPHLIADTLKDSKTKLIQMSTDCVFAGNSGPYFENSVCDGTSLYDRSKALGEVNDLKNLTFRNSIIGPDMNHNGIGLFNWFMKQKVSINGFSGAIWTGVTTLTLAKAMEKAIAQNLCGLYNLVNNESISKYDLLQLFNRHFFNNQVVIEIEEKFQLDKSLRNTRNDFLFEVPSYDQMVKEMHDWIIKYKALYPNY